MGGQAITIKLMQCVDHERSDKVSGFSRPSHKWAPYGPQGTATVI